MFRSTVKWRKHSNNVGHGKRGGADRGRDSRYSIGNIIAAVLVMVVCGALALHAISDDSSTRIGRNSEFVTAFGLLGVVIAGWTVITGIRSRRR